LIESPGHVVDAGQVSARTLPSSWRGRSVGRTWALRSSAPTGPGPPCRRAPVTSSGSWAWQSAWRRPTTASNVLRDRLHRRAHAHRRSSDPHAGTRLDGRRVV